MKVTIITPVLNSVKDIEKCILSVASQTYQNKEHLIVDGVSTDGTLEIVKRYAAIWHHIRFISEKDKGIYDAMNKGIDLSNGDWLYFMGSDDQLYSTTVLEELFGGGDCDTYDVVYGNVLWGNTGEIYGGKFSTLKLMNENLCHQSIFYRSQIFGRIGKFDTKYRVWADYVLNLRVFNDFSLRVAYIEKIIAKYGTDGISSNNEDQDFLRNRESIFEEILPVEYVGNWKALQQLKFENDLKGCWLTEKDKQLYDKNLQLDDLNKNVAEQGRHITEMNRLLADREVKINALLNSCSWKVTKPLRDILNIVLYSKDLLATVQSLLYKLLMWVDRNIVSKHALFIYIAQLTKRLFRVGSIGNSYVKSEPTILTHEDPDCRDLQEQDISVSVVIPTKDAGPEFDNVLKMIKRQKKIQNIEIIVVDSGSKDSTREYAKAHAARIVDINPEEFTHSYSRNLGAEYATGDYLFFTVQDALLPSDEFLYEMYVVYAENAVSAVSCAEFPRNDVDLFYRICCKNHYKFLGVSNQDKIFELPEVQNYITLRQNGQLSDLACFIGRETFYTHKYRFEYAEDLDLGVRLIKSGHKIAFLGTIKIIHSHNRSPFYYLKRGYADQIFLTRVFPDYPTRKVCSEDLAAEICSAYLMLSQFLADQCSKLQPPYNPHQFSELIKEFANYHTLTIIRGSGIDKIATYDDKFNAFVDSLFDCYFEVGSPIDFDNNLFAHDFINMLNLIDEYLIDSCEIIDNVLHEDIVKSIYKYFALAAGVNIANCRLFDADGTEQFLKNIKLDIAVGV